MKDDSLPYRPCVGIMVLNREGRVWMGHRPVIHNDEFKPDDRRWQMPQGGIDEGEDPLEAAKRELWEETGITSAELLGGTDDWLYYDLPADLRGKALRGKWRGQKQKWFAFRFFGADSEINIADPPHGAPIEFDKWEWVEYEQVATRIVEFKREVYEQVTERFRRFAESR